MPRLWSVLLIVVAILAVAVLSARTTPSSRQLTITSAQDGLYRAQEAYDVAHRLERRDDPKTAVEPAVAQETQSMCGPHWFRRGRFCNAKKSRQAFFDNCSRTFQLYPEAPPGSRESLLHTEPFEVNPEGSCAPGYNCWPLFTGLEQLPKIVCLLEGWSLERRRGLRVPEDARQRTEMGQAAFDKWLNEQRVALDAMRYRVVESPSSSSGQLHVYEYRFNAPRAMQHTSFTAAIDVASTSTASTSSQQPPPPPSTDPRSNRGKRKAEQPVEGDFQIKRVSDGVVLCESTSEDPYTCEPEADVPIDDDDTFFLTVAFYQAIEASLEILLFDTASMPKNLNPKGG